MWYLSTSMQVRFGLSACRLSPSDLQVWLPDTVSLFLYSEPLSLNRDSAYTKRLVMFFRLFSLSAKLRCFLRFSNTVETQRLTKLDPNNHQQIKNYYAILSVTRNATAAEIKAAYHRALLLHHPDKRFIATPDEKNIHFTSLENGVDIGTLKAAFNTLTSPELRAEYDAIRTNDPSGPRPAQVVSLEEFYQLELEHGSAEDSRGDHWAYDCRCGGNYVITEKMMEEEHHLVGCNSCSEAVWVGYELADDEEGS